MYRVIGIQIEPERSGADVSRCKGYGHVDRIHESCAHPVTDYRTNRTNPRPIGSESGTLNRMFYLDTSSQSSVRYRKSHRPAR